MERVLAELDPGLLAVEPQWGQIWARVMLQDFIVAHRDLIVERARRRVRERALVEAGDAKLEHGVPLFLTQLVAALAPVALLGTRDPPGTLDPRKTITDSATLNGHELLRNGFSVAQVVQGYADVCEIVIELCAETKAAISAADRQVFNGCVNDAIAGAVTAYGRRRERALGATPSLERALARALFQVLPHAEHGASEGPNQGLGGAHWPASCVGFQPNSGR